MPSGSVISWVAAVHGILRVPLLAWVAWAFYFRTLRANGKWGAGGWPRPADRPPLEATVERRVK